ncbi:hypothetical protein PAHAL_7G024700 [Panicum hallii]|uniref:Uncharacterized protein n=1 Tax=Panicum hallii TaxID=206008 RepID=A0A2T8IAS9_9POAL|nr:hypothetical protein PAHAL_7G024700 [Panicum hallii]
MGLWPTGKQQNRGMLLKQRSLTQIFLLLWHSTHDNLYTPRLHLLHRAAPAPHPPPRRPPLRRSEGAQLCPAAARPSPVSPRCHRLVGVRPPSHSLWSSSARWFLDSIPSDRRVAGLARSDSLPSRIKMELIKQHRLHHIVAYTPVLPVLPVKE